MEEKGLPKKCEIMGHEIELSKIKNPHIRRAINIRGGFLFSEQRDHSDHKEHKKSSRHSDCMVGKDYSERSGHSDYQSKGSPRHLDKTSHEDYAQHNDSSYDPTDLN